MEKALLVVKLARPRTWTFAIVSYLFGYMATSTPITWQIILGVIIFAFGTAATNLINVYTDIEEDAINLPFRMEMVRKLGRRNLEYVLLSIYPLILILSAPFGLHFVLVVAFAELDSIAYSLPPLRFKRNPVTALIAFSGAVILPFIAGLVIAGSSLLNPLLIFLGSFMFAYGTVKNIPDIMGDFRTGLKTTATFSVNLKRTVRLSAFLLLVPYIVLFSMVVLNMLSSVYLADVVFLPFVAYWTLRNNKASNLATLEQLHTFGFIYAVSFILFNLILTYPSQLSLGISTLILSFILIVTKAGMDSRQRHPAKNFGIQNLKLEEENFGSYMH